MHLVILKKNGFRESTNNLIKTRELELSTPQSQLAEFFPGVSEPKKIEIPFPTYQIIERLSQHLYYSKPTLFYRLRVPKVSEKHVMRYA